jgi:DNA replication and repair protein RecF
MILSSISLTGYRNYRQQACLLCPGINLILGENGQGKTNLVESIYYISIGKAYRQSSDSQIIRWGDKLFQIEGLVEGRRGSARINIRFKQDERPPKTVSVNGLQVKRWDDVSGLLTSVLFSPESLSIIKGSPQDRRSFLDYDVSQISLAYGSNLGKYRRILSQRNALLRKFSTMPLHATEKKERLSVWNQQLIQYGSLIIEKRIAFVNKLAPMVRLIHRKLTDNKENI